MYCPRCGSHNDDKATACAMCEFVFPPDLARPQSAPPPPRPADHDESATAHTPLADFEPEPGLSFDTSGAMGFETVAATPMAYGPGAAGSPPNALPWAIMSNLCCCNVLGVVAVIYAAQSGAKWHAGDFDGAREAHRQAVIFTWISVGVMALFYLLYAAVLIVAAVSGEL